MSGRLGNGCASQRPGPPTCNTGRFKRSLKRGDRGCGRIVDNCANASCNNWLNQTRGQTTHHPNEVCRGSGRSPPQDMQDQASTQGEAPWWCDDNAPTCGTSISCVAAAAVGDVEREDAEAQEGPRSPCRTPADPRCAPRNIKEPLMTLPRFWAWKDGDMTATKSQHPVARATWLMQNVFRSPS